MRFPPRCCRTIASADHGGVAHWNVRLELQILARAVLSPRPPREGSPRVLRHALRCDRAQCAVLSHADTGSGQTLARHDARRFYLCLEGVEVHHALEAVERKLAQQYRTDGDAAAQAPPQGGPGAVPAAAAHACEPRAIGVVPQAVAQAATLRVRVPARELVRAKHPRPLARARRRAVPLGPPRRAGALGGDGAPRLRPRARPGRALPRPLSGGDTASVGARYPALAAPAARRLLLLRQRPEERGSEGCAAPARPGVP